MDPDLFAQLRKQLQVPAVQADATAVASRRPRPLRAKPPVGMQLPATSRIRAVLDSVLPIPGRMRDPDPETIRRAVEFITEEEKFRPNAYKDRVGANHPWTVGYGRTGPDVDSLTTMTEPEARRWTEQRTRENAQAIMREGAEPHPALLSYAYNAGLAVCARPEPCKRRRLATGIELLTLSNVARPREATPLASAASCFAVWSRAVNVKLNLFVEIPPCPAHCVRHSSRSHPQSPCR